MQTESNQKLTISKFGGTSMGDAICMSRSAEICVMKKSNLVVVSATSGTTNDLIKIGQLSEQQKSNESEEIIAKIKAKHQKIAQDLNCPKESLILLDHLFVELESLAKGIFLLKDCSAKAMDTLVSLGERMSSLLFTQALSTAYEKQSAKIKVRLIDARDFIKTDDNFGKAKPLFNEIQKHCELGLKELIQGKLVGVTQGFIGSTVDGHTTTLGRGGSDYSAAIFAEGLSAQVLEIWTDVDGIATTDPRLCAQAKSIPEISFKEASELAIFGAKVLHPATLLPAMRKNIPTFVGSSFHPQGAGTWIKKEAGNYPLIRAIALRKNQALVTLTTPEMLNAHGFLYQIFQVFNAHQVSIDAITTSEISISVTLEESAMKNKVLFADLAKFADVQIEENLSLVALIGNNINHTSGLAKNIFEAISDINVRMISSGASKHNFCFLVDDSMGPIAVQKLHSKFI